MSKTDILIIGGGVVGSSIAYHLRQDGYNGRIVVIERDPTYARASSNLAMGGMRQQFTSIVNIRMVQYSVGFYEGFDRRMGLGGAHPPANLKQRGYLFLADQQNADALQRRFELEKQHGAEVEWLGPGELRQKLPEVFLDDALFGVLGPRDGYANVRAVLGGFRKGAAEAGAEYVHDEVTAIERSESRVTGVVLRSGERYDAPIVVNAAGAYAGAIGRLAGADVPVQPVRQHLFRARLPKVWPYRFPMVVDPGGVHWRHDDVIGGPAGEDRIVVAKTRMDEPAGENFTCDRSRWEADFQPDLLRRVPGFAPLELMEGWAGLYEMTPDHNPIICEHPALSGFFLANGFSGHGVMMAPATGKVVSELIRMGRSDTVDIGPFDLGRFARGELLYDEATI
jgi:FAD-dependent oxidoreductase domain-containing protein 1